jgi:hypothetical protein
MAQQNGSAPAGSILSTLENEIVQIKNLEEICI